MPNANVNHVVIDGVTKIDLRSDTVTPASLMQGYTAHDASGAAITGTADTVTGSVYQDADGYLVVDDDESSAPQGTLSITANGTYDVSDYAGATVDIGGMSETDLKNFITRSNSFTDIDWPDGLTTIGAYAFGGCYRFNTASLPDTITSIGTYAFYNCSNLTLTSLPNNITSIGTYAFGSCSNLALTSLPNGITSINSYTFGDCANLALTSLPSGIVSIYNYAFYNCPNLALTSLPNTVTSISSSAFMNCRNITISELPIGVTSLQSNAFTGCTSITSIRSDAVITSTSYPFMTGTASNPTMSLTSVSFPNMDTSSIGYLFGNVTAAYACQLLAFADIGSTKQISSNAFANCYALETLVLRRSDAICALANVSAFTNTPMRGYNNLTGTVYVPSALISSYQSATNWSTLYNGGTVTFAAIEGSDYERE